MIDGSVLPEGYEVVEVSDGSGCYEYVVQKVEEDFSWCNDSGYDDVFDIINDFWDEEA